MRPLLRPASINAAPVVVFATCGGAANGALPDRSVGMHRNDCQARQIEHGGIKRRVNTTTIRLRKNLTEHSGRDVHVHGRSG